MTWVDSGLKFAESGMTPGSHLLRVIDKASCNEVLRVKTCNVDEGVALVYLEDSAELTELRGDYEIQVEEENYDAIHPT